MGVHKNSAIDPQEDHPESQSGGTIITVAIACCGFALALVLAAAYVGL
jgi:hypothetical protein